MAAKCDVSQVPRTWTRMTMSKSAGVMFQMAGPHDAGVVDQDIERP